MHAQSLSPDARISVLTCDPGNELHSVFGHTSVWVSDPTRGIDEVYNYGMFSFEESNFLLNFLKGKLHYSLGKTSIDRFLYTYRYYKRGVRMQELNLDAENKERYYRFLQHNYLPENRKYWYDYFYDNCSSRVGHSLEAELVGFSYPDTSITKQSFRDYLDEYLGDFQWMDFGIDLIQGQPADQLTTFREAMFLPDYLESHLDRATYISGGKVTPLVGKREAILSYPKSNQKSLFTPLNLFILLLVLEVALFFFFKDRMTKLLRIYDFTWFFVVGVASLIMLGMWFLTEHQACRYNWNLLWASPLYVVLMVAWKKTKLRRGLSLIILATTLLSIIGCCWLIPQQFHIAVIPICLILGLKLGRYILETRSSAMVAFTSS